MDFANLPGCLFTQSLFAVSGGTGRRPAVLACHLENLSAHGRTAQKRSSARGQAKRPAPGAVWPAMLERLNQEIKRRTHVVRIFPNVASCLRLVRALAVETHENWLEAIRYLNMEHLHEAQEGGFTTGRQNKWPRPPQSSRRAHRRQGPLRGRLWRWPSANLDSVCARRISVLRSRRSLLMTWRGHSPGSCHPKRFPQLNSCDHLRAFLSDRRGRFSTELFERYQTAA